MANTYYKIKIICDYGIPIALSVGTVLIFAGVVLKNYIQEKREEKRKNGKVRKKDDAD